MLDSGDSPALQVAITAHFLATGMQVAITAHFLATGMQVAITENHNWHSLLTEISCQNTSVAAGKRLVFSVLVWHSRFGETAQGAQGAQGAQCG